MSSIQYQVDKIVQELSEQDQCTTCHDVGSIIICVPNPADIDAPEYNPTECPECGRALLRKRTVVGISWDDI